MRELLAETLNISPTQVGRLETIDKNLVPEAKAALKNQEISFSKAVEIAKLPEAEQKKEVKKEVEKEVKKETVKKVTLNGSDNKKRTANKK